MFNAGHKTAAHLNRNQTPMQGVSWRFDMNVRVSSLSVFPALGCQSRFLRDAPPPMVSVDTGFAPQKALTLSEPSRSQSHRGRRSRRSWTVLPAAKSCEEIRIGLFEQFLMVSLVVLRWQIQATPFEQRAMVLVQATGCTAVFWCLIEPFSRTCAPFRCPFVWTIQSTFRPSTLFLPLCGRCASCTVAFVFESGSWLFIHHSLSTLCSPFQTCRGVMDAGAGSLATTCKCLCVASPSVFEDECEWVSPDVLRFAHSHSGLSGQCPRFAEMVSEAYNR
ncbi:hypothetical protein BU23DRAFT_78976 [Bimuria novae-zelandiae CBS 107.79]|uniref:Uncharacterized protein n=1 Tax=Bimuria novae-zelandiae CBS 107.79 TaxID=1447943 RepID=A0A6A5VDG5_9PLEO|nr:hypothetical protein BU23DRAFT_78976 [Bimuria novae-zelandiae CBS 107.79]